LSPELSADLALEIVLNEIVEQACLATGATGAAIVLRREDEMICRASSGSTAPDLGSRLDTSSGLSAECVKTLRTQRCGDVLTDTRADVAASQRLGVRSVVVMPLVCGEKLLGFFELFSSQPFAFGDRDERTLEALASRVLDNIDQALRPQPPADVLPAPDVPEAPPDEPKNVSARESDFVTLVLAGAVLVCAVLLGVLVGRHLGGQKATVRTHPSVPSSAAVSPGGAESLPASANPPGKVEGGGESAQPAASKPRVTSSVPPGGLLVYENGREIFRMPPTQGGSAATAGDHALGIERASSIASGKNEQEEGLELPPAVAENSLLYRVEPEYPEEARQQQIQGAVVMEVHTNPEGAVQDVELISGPPQLAQAASDAVKQWRFKPLQQNGRAVRMHTRITLNFRLPR
jgi:TonB family protein